MKKKPGTSFWNSEKSSEPLTIGITIALSPVTARSTGTAVSVSAAGLLWRVGAPLARS